MPDENRVFDVTRPKNVNPSATSKPVIVGHQPMVNDPMVKDDGQPLYGSHHSNVEPTKIMVNNESDDDQSKDLAASTLAPAIIDPPSHEAPVETIPHYEGPAVIPTSPQDSPAASNNAFSGIVPPTNQPPAAHPVDDIAMSETASPTQSGHIEGLHLDRPKRRRREPLLALLVILILVGIYLGLDAAGLNVPYHLLKHSKPAATTSTNTPPPPSQNMINQPAVPDGFKEYKISGTNITFAAPLAWGDPTSTVDPGYSKRGGTNQSDGTYAYLVNFATNKDIQIAVTSNKYLPAARVALYYDYLQWCTGTADQKFYQSILHFTTTDKVDTPTTTTCDQGPLADATKLDSTTILQPKATDSQNKVIGDVYTKNLDDPSLVVFRVKDAAMTNGDNIKQLLNTVKASSTL